MNTSRPVRVRSRFRPCAIAAAIATAAGAASGVEIKTVFVIAMENHNWTAPAGTSPAQLSGHPQASYLNSLCTPGNPNAAQVSFAGAYHNAGVGVHPSEPSYIWMEAGSNLGVFSDNPPYGTGGTNQVTTNHLATKLTAAGVSWKSYQEDIDTDSAGNVLPLANWTSPINNRAGTYTTVANIYNGSRKYDYAAKHNPMIFFSDTNGGNDASTANPARYNYAPLQQFFTDLANNTVPKYCWISPNQFNDMHTGISGFQGFTGDTAAIRQGDNFLSIVVPQIMASAAYQDHGAIFIWFDETEGGDSAAYTIPFVVISPDAKGNAYTNAISYTHSSSVRTLQNIFRVATAYLNDAANAADLSDLFNPNVTNVLTPCPADFNADRVVNVLDLGTVLSSFGASVPAYTSGDTNGDGVVDTLDLGAVLAAFGSNCP